MKLIVQPDAGVAPVLAGIKQAKRALDVVIFRLDRRDIVDALIAAVKRGVSVRALTAYTNKGGEKRLRKVEMLLLDGGVTVSRTANDLVRYHGKMMIIDGRVLHVYGFNFTKLDIDKSRSFGIITGNRRLVQEATRLFGADFDRKPYSAGLDRFIVSPENSRERLLAFVKGARKQLLIYDPKVSHPAFVRALIERAKSGVEIKVIGKCAGHKGEMLVEKYPGKRLHVRAIVRDERFAFVGSQSLRKLELEKRREVGVIINNVSVVRQMKAIFEQDWAETDTGKKQAKKAEKADKAEKKNAAESAIAAAS
jgi:phosphatidylserine/phosphatidylglycerophosphate/cardiolipin synthase-like enzyme